MKVVVVGAGIVGCATAHALLADGHEVTILDAHHPAYGPSQGNAGWIAHTDILPLASSKALRNLPRYLLDPLGPLAIRPAYALKIAPWMLRFLIASRPEAVERSTVALTSLQQLALPAWLTLAGEIGLGGMIHRKGGLYLHDNEAEFEAASRLAVRQRSAGFGVSMVRAEELRQMEPALKPGFFVGAAHVEDSAHISDPRALTLAVFEAALARGARYEQRQVELIQPAARPVLIGPGGWQMIADKVVLTAGIWSKPLAAALGDDVPLDTERGYNISFPGMTGLTTRPLSFEGHGFVATPLESGLRIGGAVEFGGLKLAPNHARTRALHAKAQRFLHDVPAYETGTEWMGFRPSLPDSLPVIGVSSRSADVVHAFGHGHFGMTQSAVTGRLVADLVAGRTPPIDLAPFSAKRF
jgi:D-amino-acid dehydrogenase